MRLGPRYQVLALLGEGAMGQVYLAKHLELGRKEAVKVLRPEVAADERFVARFRREARATERLHHSNIVAMYDFGQLPDGRFFMAMEYVDGAPLSKILKDLKGPLDVGYALNLICQLAAAVEHAHSRGVLHRDLKPANLMLVQRRDREDDLKVLDFGVAKIISPEYIESMMISQEGVVFGTPLYMAPEQFQSQYDPRSDIYAIGCISYELLTGSPPFLGRISEVIRAHATDPPVRLTEVVREVPRRLDEIIMKCLAKEPEDRFQTGGDLLADLIILHPRHQELSDAGAGDSGLVPNLASYDIYESVNAQAKAASDTMSLRKKDLVDDDDDETTQEVRAREQALFDLAEALRDYGASDVRLTITIADARALQTEQIEWEEARYTLSVREARALESATEQEHRLGFAIRDLKVDRDHSGGGPSLDFQIRALEKRLEEAQTEAEAERARLAAEAIDLAVQGAEIEDKREDIYDRLAVLIEEFTDEFEDHEQVSRYFATYRNLIGDE